MATTQRSRSGRPSAPQSDPATRGLILVVVAVVIGLALLFKGVSDGSSEQGADDPTDTTVAEVPEEDPSSSTPTSMATPTTNVPPSGLVVAAANSTGTGGVAKKAQTRLAAQGYTATKAVNGAAQSANSAVYSLPGFEADAEAVAAALGLTGVTAQPLPETTASLVKDPIPGAQVVVILGADALELPAITGKAPAVDSSTATTAGATTAGATTAGATTAGAAGVTTTAASDAAEE